MTWQQTPCMTDPALFDSTLLADHRKAGELCRTACDLREWCEGELRKARDMQMMSDPRCGPRGTWAGHLVGGLGKPEARCGTDSGYHHHVKVVHEMPCRACRQAHAEAEASRSTNVDGNLETSNKGAKMERTAEVREHDDGPNPAASRQDRGAKLMPILPPPADAPLGGR